VIRTGHDPELGCGLMLAAVPSAALIVLVGWILVTWLLSLASAVPS
jgi:hypothetical protein